MVQDYGVGRLRVMHIIARMNVGGPAVELATLMRGLNSDEFEQVLLCGWCDQNEADFLLTQAQDLAVCRVAGLGRALQPWDDVRAFLNLVRSIRSFKPDVVHTHTAKAGVLGRLAAKASGVQPRVVHTYHGHLLFGYFGRWRTKLMIVVERTLAAMTDVNIAVGRQVRSDLLGARIGTPERFKVIYSGVSLKEIPDQRTAKLQLGLDPSSTVLTYLGRLTNIKRPDRFVEVMRLVSERHDDVAFLVVGSGEQAPSVEIAVRDGNLPALLLGWRLDIENVLAATDIMVLTSDNEGIPLSLIEAGLASKASVATHVGAVPEVILHGETGLLSSTSALELADLCSRLVTDSAERKRMAVAASRHIEKRFSVSQFLDGHARVYRTLASSTSTKSFRA